MKIFKINLMQLITFYFVAKEQSFTAASEKLFVTEAAVSQQVRALEVSAGVKLVYVKKRKVHLTQAGQILLGYAEKIYDQARMVNIFLEENRENSLRVGVAVTFIGIVSSAIAQIANLFPDINLRTDNAPSHIIISQLLDLQYDVAIVESVDYQTNKLIATRLSEGERLLLATSWSTPIEASDSLNLADLSDYKFLLPPPGSDARKIILDRAKAEGLELHLVEVKSDYPDYYESILTKMDKSIGLLPEAEARRVVSEGKLRILHLTDELRVKADALIVKDSPRREIVEKFIKLAKQAFDASHTGVLPTIFSQEPN